MIKRRIFLKAAGAGGVRRVAYRSTLTAEDSPPLWTFEFSGSKIVGGVPPSEE